MAQGQWTLVVCDGSGNTLRELTRAAGISLTFTRNGVPECTFSVSHDDDECATILTALMQGTGRSVPALKGYRIGADGTKVLRFNGYLATISEESGTEASTATFTFRGPFGRVLGDGSSRGREVNFIPAQATGKDAGQIATALLAAVADADNTAVQISVFGSNFGTGTAWVGIQTTGTTIEATKLRDRNYPLWTNVGEAIISLSSVLDGFDFEVTPTEGTALRGALMGLFNVYARQGQDRPAVKFEYGEKTLSNCSAMHRQTLPPINRATVVGANGLYGQQQDFASQTKYGLWATNETQSDVSEQATLDDKANALLRPNPVKTIDFTPEPRLAPSPWDDYWIGDTVYFYANRNALTEGPAPVRVNQITVAIDPDSGLETTTVPDPVSPEEERVIRAGLQTEVVS